MTLATAISIWLLTAGVIGNTLHIVWVFRRHLRLSHRVHHLEMERDFPGYTQSNQDEVQRDQWDR